MKLLASSRHFRLELSLFQDAQDAPAFTEGLQEIDHIKHVTRAFGCSLRRKNGTRISPGMENSQAERLDEMNTADSAKYNEPQHVKIKIVWPRHLETGVRPGAYQWIGVVIYLSLLPKIRDIQRIRETLEVLVRLIKHIHLHILIDSGYPFLYNAGLDNGLSFRTVLDLHIEEVTTKC